MKLLVTVLNEPNLLNKVLENLEEHEIYGCTILESKGMANELLRNEEFAFFGMLRKCVKKEHANNVTLLIALKEECLTRAIEAIEDVTGSFDQPDTGIMMVLPIELIKGLKL